MQRHQSSVNNFLAQRNSMVHHQSQPLSSKPHTSHTIPDPITPKVSEEGNFRVYSSATVTEGFTVRLMDGIATFSLLALFFGLPIFFAGVTLQGPVFDKQLYFYFWLLIGLVCWVIKGVLLNEMHIRRTPLDMPIFFFLGVYLVSTLLSMDRWHSLWGSFGDPSRSFLSVLSLVIAYYFVFSHLNGHRLRWAIWALAVSGWILAIWSALMIMHAQVLPESWQTFVPLSLTGSLGTLALVLAALLPIWISLLTKLQTKENKRNILIHASRGMLLSSIIATLFLLLVLYDYTAWWAVLIGFGFFLVYILSRIINFSEEWKWLPMFVVVALLTAFMIGNVNIARVSLPVEVSPSASLSWGVAIQSLKDGHFLFGSGPSTYGYVFSQYRPQEYNLQPLYTMRFSQGKGVLFEILPTAGAVGAFALALLWLSFLSVGLYLLSQFKESEKIYSLGLWGSVVILMLGTLLVPVNGTVVLLGSLVAALALATLLKESHSEERFWQLSLKSSPKYALVFAFLFIVVSASVAFLFVFIGKIAVADAEAGKAVRLANTSHISEATEILAQSVKYIPQEGRYSSMLGQLYIALIRERVSTEEGKQDIETLKRYLTSASNAVILGRDASPIDVSAYEVVAQNYENMIALTGPSQAISDNLQKTYEKASELEPNNPLFYLKLGQLKQAQAAAAKDNSKAEILDAARDSFEKAIDKKPDLGEGYAGLALTQETGGDVDGSIRTLRGGLEKIPGNILLKYSLGRSLSERGHEDDLKEALVMLNDVVSVDTKNVNAYLELALANEKAHKDSGALQAYQKILDILADDTSDMGKKVKDKVRQMMENIRSGKSNVADMQGSAGSAHPSGEQAAASLPPVTPAPEVPTTSSPSVSASPSAATMSTGATPGL